MRRLVLDVDGVVLDAERGGDGHWTNELHRRFGVERASLRASFFAPHWNDIVTGQTSIEPALARALTAIGSAATVEEVLACWFEADFVPVPATIELARSAAAVGIPITLATNQERRRAAFLRERLGALFAVDDVVASCDVGVGKPDPAFFRAVDDRLGTDVATSVVFVDDHAENVAAASRHGWQAVLADPAADWVGQAESLLGLDGD